MQRLQTTLTACVFFVTNNEAIPTMSVQFYKRALQPVLWLDTAGDTYNIDFSSPKELI